MSAIAVLMDPAKAGSRPRCFRHLATAGAASLVYRPCGAVGHELKQDQRLAIGAAADL